MIPTAVGHDFTAAASPTCPVCVTGLGRYFQQVEARHYWRCPSCEATYLDPRQLPGREEERREYDLHRNHAHDPGYRRFLSKAAEPLAGKLAAGSRGLDFGCGPGPALAAMMQEIGHAMALYDPFYFDDPKVLERAYDFVTCTEVFEHLHRPAEELDRIDGLLRPGGWLAVMTTFQTDDAAFANWNYRRDPSHVVFYRASTFEYLARNRGWRLEIPTANVVLMRKPA